MNLLMATTESLQKFFYSNSLNSVNFLLTKYTSLALDQTVLFKSLLWFSLHYCRTKKITPLKRELILFWIPYYSKTYCISDENQCHRLQKNFFESQFPFMSNKKHFAEKAMTLFLFSRLINLDIKKATLLLYCILVYYNANILRYYIA